MILRNYALLEMRLRGKGQADMGYLLSKARQFVGKASYKLGFRRSPQLHRPTIQLHTEQLGSEYGGWTICPDGLSANSIVYSFGVGEDATFDRAIIERYAVNVFAFDPTPRSIEWVEAQEWPSQFSFHAYGIAATDGTAEFFPPQNSEHISYSLLHREESTDTPITVPLLRLESIAKMLGHSHIDLLKMDIEGAEYGVIPDILATSTVTIGQIAVEFHHFFAELSDADTKKAVDQLTASKYEIFYVSPSGNEYSFIRR